MSAGGPKLRDVRKLADTRASLEFEVPISALPGLPPELQQSGDRPMQVQMLFGREQGLARADVRVRGSVRLVCQRCMQPMTLSLDASSAVLLVESELRAEAAPPGWETFLAEEGRLSLEALAAEELLLALPIVPLHAAGEPCGNGLSGGPAPARDAAAEAAASATRPFEQLRELLQRRGDDLKN